ncbi:MAG: AraC family transcriptional regulator [Flavobacteriaceae bacterium]|nr:AraC family transcriptional regulator [Flavobacteriaceae bacterium]
MNSPISSKPVLEKLAPSFGSSFTLRQFDEQRQNQSDTFWHYHPEVELVYVNRGSGRRMVGSHVSHYRNGTLVLIGGNLPHSGFTDTLVKQQQETVIQFLPSFLGAYFMDVPELTPINSLLQKAKSGIAFLGEDKRRIGAQVSKLAQLQGFPRLLGLLEVLHQLAESREYRMLNADGFTLETQLEDNERINTVFNFVQNEFQRSISLTEVAELTHLTKPSFCRYFKKITGKTFVTFLLEYRLSHAAKLLHENKRSILDVCYACGFNNFSHFTKKFKAHTGRTPSAYRNELRGVLVG